MELKSVYEFNVYLFYLWSTYTILFPNVLVSLSCLVCITWSGLVSDSGFLFYILELSLSHLFPSIPLFPVCYFSICYRLHLTYQIPDE